MPTSPSKARRLSSDGYRPRIAKTTGQKPACLVNASVTYCGNNQIYAFGGFDQYTDEVYNHVLKLDLNTMNWTLVDNYGDIPGVRMGHSASLYQGDKLLVFGGENEHREYLSDVIILDLKTLHWTQPDLRGPTPKGRARHAAVVYEDKLFIVGGVTGENNYVLDDISYLDLKTWTWSRAWTFVARYDHTAWIWGGRLWVFGGLGLDMERSTEMWWLDLKGSPTFGITSPPGTATPDHGMSRSSLSSVGIAQPYASNTSGYAANSGSVQVRTTRREKPTAPGAISSLKFLSGPHVPQQACGTHFHAYSSGTLLDFVTPAETMRSHDCNLSSLELDSFRWQKLVEGPDLFHVGYRWHYCTINENGTMAWLLGSPMDGSGVLGASQDSQLSEVLVMDLRKYGMLGNDMAYEANSEQTRILANERRTATSSQGLGMDLASVFDRPPEEGSMADFVITANRDEDSSDFEDAVDERQPSSSVGSVFLSNDAETSSPIHVHKIILQARWPHFKRLYGAKMAEFHNGKLHIPEPYSVVRAFLYYLYTDSIAPSEFCQDLTDVAGMLVMANLYDMPKLRLLCVHRLSREMDVEYAATIWERAGRTGEEWLKRRAAMFCLGNWGRIVRTQGFRTLSRASLMELCEVVDMEGRVVGGDELEAVGVLGGAGYGFGSSTGSTRAKRTRNGQGSAVDETSENDAEEDDGMELS